jgi:hypothetical protein
MLRDRIAFLSRYMPQLSAGAVECRLLYGAQHGEHHASSERFKDLVSSNVVRLFVRRTAVETDAMADAIGCGRRPGVSCVPVPTGPESHSQSAPGSGGSPQCPAVAPRDAGPATDAMCLACERMVE